MARLELEHETGYLLLESGEGYLILEEPIYSTFVTTTMNEYILYRMNVNNKLNFEGFTQEYERTRR